MGKLEEGPFGNVTGKIGRLVSYNLKGKNVIRNIGVSNKPPTLKQLAVRQDMKLVNTFLNPILRFINIGYRFKVEGTNRHPHNEALSYNKKNAITGEYPNKVFDYSKAMVSMGSLEPALNPKFKKMEAAVEFTWEMAEDIDWTRKNDRAMLLIYYPETNTATYFLSGNLRSDCKQIVTLTSDYSDRKMEAYIAFFAVGTMDVSDSIYLGSGT